MELWPVQRMLIEEYLSGQQGEVAFFRAKRRAGTTTAAAVFAADHPLCYVSNISGRRMQFLEYVTNYAQQLEYKVAPIKRGYRITKPSGDVHVVYAVPPDDARPMTTIVEDGKAAPCGAPVVVYTASL